MAVSPAESPAADIDLAGLSRWSAEHLAGPVAAVARIGGGLSNEMYAIDVGDRELVLRRPPARATSTTAHDMGREYRLLTALARTDVPHPRAVALCRDVEVIGTPFLVMERIHGFTPRDPLPAPFDRDPGARRAMAWETVDALAALATVDWRAVGLEGFGRPDGFLERQVDRWTAYVRPFRTRDVPHLDQVGVWLSEHLPTGSNAPGLMHGDYQFVNVMMRHGCPVRLAAIVDWELATVGDPLLDLGWLLCRWPDPGEAQFATTIPMDYSGMPSRREMAQRYAVRSGRSVDDLEFYMVLALFRLACLLEASYAKAVRGHSAVPSHRDFGPVVIEAVDRAWHLATAADGTTARRRS